MKEENRPVTFDFECRACQSRLGTLLRVCVVAGFITYIYLNFDEIVEKQKAAVAKAEAR